MGIIKTEDESQTSLRRIIVKYSSVHYVKSVRIRSFTGSYFSAFRLNTKRWGDFSVSSPSAGKYGPEKLRTDSFRTVAGYTQIVYN